MSDKLERARMMAKVCSLRIVELNLFNGNATEEAIKKMQEEILVTILNVIEHKDWVEGKYTPTEWMMKTGITIMDPDGWRMDNKPFDEPIDEEEWNYRMKMSTIMCDDMSKILDK